MLNAFLQKPATVVLITTSIGSVYKHLVNQNEARLLIYGHASLHGHHKCVEPKPFGLLKTLLDQCQGNAPPSELRRHAKVVDH